MSHQQVISLSVGVLLHVGSVCVANDENDTYFLYQDQTRKKLYCFKQEPEEFGPYDKRYVGMIKNQAELLTFEKGKRILLPYFCRKGIGA